MGRHLSSEVFSVLQLHAISEPLFPHLKTLEWWGAARKSIPFIPLFLSPRTTIITIAFIPYYSPVAMVAPMVTAFPTLCPNLQEITFIFTPRDPIINAAVSGMLLASNRDTLQCFDADSPLTEEACEVILKLPNLRELSVIIEQDTSLPSAALPNLTTLILEYDRDGGWLPMFHGATFGKLKAVTFSPTSESIGDFLEAFGRAALVTSIQNTLTQFHLYAPCSQNKNYSPLLLFTQLTEVITEFSCIDGCSSRVDDDIIISLARAVPKLKTLRLGSPPCREIPIGVSQGTHVSRQSPPRSL